MTSDAITQDPVLVDLLSEHHHILQKVLETTWNHQSDITISKSEWNIINKIYKKQLPISHVTRSIGITRQAIHKLIKNLSDKGLIEVQKMDNNKKEKCIALTDFGRECCEKYTELKNQLENQIAMNLGAEHLKVLKDILQIDWGIEHFTQ